MKYEEQIQRSISRVGQDLLAEGHAIWSAKIYGEGWRCKVQWFKNRPRGRPSQTVPRPRAAVMVEPVPPKRRRKNDPTR